MYPTAAARRPPNRERPDLVSRRHDAARLAEPAALTSGPRADPGTSAPESLSYEAWIRGDGLRPD